jgi:hypothetical protein
VTFQKKTDELKEVKTEAKQSQDKLIDLLSDEGVNWTEQLEIFKLEIESLDVGDAVILTEFL